MPLFTIDSDKCKCDGLCAKVCPVGCIVFEQGELPAPHEKKHAYCIECGHCMAVCPTDAIALERFPAGRAALNKKQVPTAEQTELLLRSRRSVRAFRSESVDRDVLASLLDTTQFAPSGHNARPVQWAVAATPEKVAEVAGLTVEWMRGEVEKESPVAAALHLPGIVKAYEAGIDMVCRSAPALAVAHASQRGITPVEDCVIAVTYLELAAHGAGIGACWCGYVNAAAKYYAPLQEFLGVPEGHVVNGALMLGKPSRRYSAIPPRDDADVNWV